MLGIRLVMKTVWSGVNGHCTEAVARCPILCCEGDPGLTKAAKKTLVDDVCIAEKNLIAVCHWRHCPATGLPGMLRVLTYICRAKALTATPRACLAVPAADWAGCLETASRSSNVRRTCPSPADSHISLRTMRATGGRRLRRLAVDNNPRSDRMALDSTDCVSTGI